MDVCLEVGAKKVFASVLEWPGWARSGADDHAALGALLTYGPRYRSAIGMRIALPETVDVFKVLERLKGDSTTDFGAPGKPPKWDARPLAPKELSKLVRILEASWDAFDVAAHAAARKSLRKGPRGGGRDVQKMRAHCIEGQAGYLGMLGVSIKISTNIDRAWTDVRATFIDALHRRARGELPDRGPRGGARWNVRYAVRRSAWHVLDHAWEIEDRAE